MKLYDAILQLGCDELKRLRKSLKYFTKSQMDTGTVRMIISHQIDRSTELLALECAYCESTHPIKCQISPWTTPSSDGLYILGRRPKDVFKVIDRTGGFCTESKYNELTHRYEASRMKHDLLKRNIENLHTDVDFAIHLIHHMEGRLRALSNLLHARSFKSIKELTRYVKEEYRSLLFYTNNSLPE